VRFLHVIQGADGGDGREEPTYVASSGGTPFDGAAVAGTLVLFRTDLDGDFESLAVEVPGDVTRVLVTGLEPGASYTATLDGGELTVRPGTGLTADSGGVLVVSP
jgi:hypothetical protein